MPQKRVFEKLAIDNLDEFVFGSCPNPVTTKKGLVIGGGDVLPELNFTLPTMEVNEDTIDKAYTIYRNIAHDSLERAAQLEIAGAQLEYETTVEFTLNPEWGIKVNQILLEEMENAESAYGFPCSNEIKQK